MTDPEMPLSFDNLRCMTNTELLQNQVGFIWGPEKVNSKHVNRECEGGVQCFCCPLQLHKYSTEYSAVMLPPRSSFTLPGLI